MSGFACVRAVMRVCMCACLYVETALPNSRAAVVILSV